MPFSRALWDPTAESVIMTFFDGFGFGDSVRKTTERDFLEETVDFRVEEAGGACSELHPAESYSEEP